jgi:uncharacterized protein YxjI
MRYLVRERLFSITDDFWVTDEQGDKVFFIDAKILSLRHASSSRTPRAASWPRSSTSW